MHVPLVKGRAFETGEADETLGAVIVSEAFARRFLPGEEALWKRLRPHFPVGDAYWYPQIGKFAIADCGNRARHP